MANFSNSVIIFLLVVAYGNCLRPRNQFESRLRTCTALCAVDDQLHRNSVQKCLVFLNHDNATVTECAARCLERKRESLAKAVECECRDRKCVSSSQATSTTSATPTTSTTGTPFNTSTTEIPSTTSSTTALPTTSTTTTSSTTPPTTPPEAESTTV